MTNEQDYPGYDDAAFILASKYRQAAFELIADQPQTVTSVAEILDLNVQNVSKAVTQLKDAGLVEVAGDHPQHKIHHITEDGETALSAIGEVLDE